MQNTQFWHLTIFFTSRESAALFFSGAEHIYCHCFLVHTKIVTVVPNLIQIVLITYRGFFNRKQHAHMDYLKTSRWNTSCWEEECALRMRICEPWTRASVFDKVVQISHFYQRITRITFTDLHFICYSNLSIQKRHDKIAVVDSKSKATDQTVSKKNWWEQRHLAAE